MIHHHAYVGESIPVLQEFTQKVARVHGTKNPKVVSIDGLFNEIALEMQQHMAKGERVLFPLVKEMEDADRSVANASAPKVRYGTRFE